MSLNIQYIIEARDRFSKTCDKVSNSIDRVNKKALKASSVIGGRFKRSLSGAASKMRELGDLALAVAPAFAFREMLAFSEAINNVKAVSGATGKEFEKLKKQAQDLGRTTRFSATQAAQGQAFLAKAGFESKKIFDAMPDTLNLAAAANLDLGTSADIVSNVMAGYGIQTQDLGFAVDVLTKAFTSSNTDLQQLGEAMKYAGPVAKAFNQDFAETTAILGAMGNAGFQGSLGGIALKNAIVRLGDPVPKVAKTIKALGIKINGTDGEMLHMIDIMKQLEKSGASAAQIMTIFGLRAGPAMAALLTQGSKGIQESIKQLKEADEISKKISETQMEGLYGAWTKLTSAISGTVIALGQAGLEDLLVGILNTIRGVVIGVGKVLEYAIIKPIAWAIKNISNLGASFSDLLFGSPEIKASSNQNINSRLDITIADKGNNVKSAIGTTSAGSMNMNIGKNLAGVY